MSPERRDSSGFTHEEMRQIFERAGISEATRDDARRYSLAEVEAIGADAGLDLGDIRRAAATVHDASVAQRILGAPTRFHAVHVLPQPLGEDRLAEVVDALRSDTNLHGELRFVPDGVEWRARPALGAIIVHFAPRRKGTRASVLVTREDAALLTVLVGCGLGFVVGTMAGVAVASQAGAGLGLAAFAAGTVAGGVGIMRLLWRQTARRGLAVTKALLGTIVSVTESVSGEVPD
jgi:hypothetical protein